jgi:hypothetical protein
MISSGMEYFGMHLSATCKDWLGIAIYMLELRKKEEAGQAAG